MVLWEGRAQASHHPSWRGRQCLRASCVCFPRKLVLVPEPRVGGRGRVTQATADPGKGGNPHLRPCLTHSPQPTSASRPAPLPTQHGPTPPSENGAAPRWPGPTPCLLASEEETWEQRRSAVRQPACARGRRQRLPPRTAWTAAPRVSAKPPGSGGPCAPGPAPRPPALPWLQPGPGRLRLDSARATRGRSCVPTSPHRLPPPAAQRADRPGAGPGGGARRRGAGRGGAAPGRGLHLRGAGSRRRLGKGWLGKGWPARRGALQLSTPGDRVQRGVRDRASLVTWLFLTQPLKSGLPRQRSTVGVEPVPKEKGRAHLVSPGEEAFGRRGGFASQVGEKRSVTPESPQGLWELNPADVQVTDCPYRLYTS